MNWLRRLFGRPDPARNLFAYHDGTRRRWADPVAAWAVLEAGDAQSFLKAVRPAAGRPPADLEAAEKLARDQKAAREAAVGRLGELACEAFGVEGLSDAGGKPAGLTLAERVALVVQFVTYLRGLAVAAGPKAGPPPSTGSAPAG